jgi:hypothetical protein
MREDDVRLSDHLNCVRVAVARKDTVLTIEKIGIGGDRQAEKCEISTRAVERPL